MTTHGHTRGPRKSKEYRAWRHMKSRCLNPSVERYPNYGGRGITVCSKWINSFEAFFSDVGFAPSSKHSIDRIDNDGNYEPGNVRWATTREQILNSRHARWITHNGTRLTIGEWAKRCGIKRRTLQMRLDQYGWSVARALETPTRAKAIL